MLLHILHIFPMKFQCFQIALAGCHFQSLRKSSTRQWQHDALQGAHVHETSLCVMYFALRSGPKISSFCWCSKYVTFSITFCALVLQNTLCVAYGAIRRSPPSRLWGGPLATWAAKPSQESRSTPSRRYSGHPGPQRRVPHNLLGPASENNQTSGVVSSVTGCAMHMKWPDGIGRGSWDWENPRQESANPIPALPVLTGHAIGCPSTGGSGQAPLTLFNTIYTYIYIYIYCCWSG